MSKLGPISHFLSPVSCDSLVLQGLRCEWGAGVLNLVLSLSLSHTGHWKFNMAPRSKELSEDLKKRNVALDKDGVGYKKIAKTLKLSCSTVAKTIQRFNRTAVMWVILRGQQMYSYTSCTHCSKVSFLQCCHMKRYNTLFNINVRGVFCEILCIYLYIYAFLTLVQ